MLGANVIDPKLSGYNFRITVGTDGKSLCRNANRKYGKNRQAVFWMDQTDD